MSISVSLILLLGPNNVSLFKADGEPSEVNSKLVLYYTPQVIIFSLIHTYVLYIYNDSNIK